MAICKELNADNMTKIGMTLEACEERLNHKYFSTRKEMFDHLTGESEILQADFHGVLDKECIRMNEYMCTRYFSIATKAIYDILEMICDFGKSNLASFDSDSKADLEKAIGTQYRNCRLLFGTSLGLWSVPTHIHGQFEIELQKFRSTLVEIVATKVNEQQQRSQLFGGKRKVGNLSKANTAVTTTLSPGGAGGSSSSSSNSLAEQKRKAALYRDTVLKSKSSAADAEVKEIAATVEPKRSGAKKSSAASPVATAFTATGGKTKKRKVSAVECIEIGDDDEGDGDPVAIALAESRRKEQMRQNEIIAKLKSSSEFQKSKVGGGKKVTAKKK